MAVLLLLLLLALGGGGCWLLVVQRLMQLCKHVPAARKGSRLLHGAILLPYTACYALQPSAAIPTAAIAVCAASIGCCAACCCRDGGTAPAQPQVLHLQAQRLHVAVCSRQLSVSQVECLLQRRTLALQGRRVAWWLRCNCASRTGQWPAERSFAQVQLAYRHGSQLAKVNQATLPTCAASSARSQRAVSSASRASSSCATQRQHVQIDGLAMR